MGYEDTMRKLARQLIVRHGELVEVRCISGHNPCHIELQFADGEVILVREHTGAVDISMMKAGYHGTGSRCFHAFLSEAGYDLTFDQVVSMAKGTTLRDGSILPPPEPPAFEKMVAQHETSALIEAFKNGESLKIRCLAADALGKLGDPAAVEPLLSALMDAKEELRIAILRALGEIGDPRAVETIIESYKGQDVPVYEAGAHALGMIGDLSAVPALLDKLDSRFIIYRLPAIEALQQISGQSIGDDADAWRQWWAENG